jgi:hypothetical protein
MPFRNAKGTELAKVIQQHWQLLVSVAIDAVLAALMQSVTERFVRLRHCAAT